MDLPLTSLARAEAAEGWARAGDAGCLQAGPPLLLMMAERQHGHLLPRWLVAIFLLQVLSGTPGKQYPSPAPSSSALAGAVAQLSPTGSILVLVPLRGQRGCCPKEAWSPPLLTPSDRKRLFTGRKLSGSCIGLGGSFLVQEIPLGQKSCLYLSIH